jgi:hypothetical protein
MKILKIIYKRQFRLGISYTNPITLEEDGTLSKERIHYLEFNLIFWSWRLYLNDVGV